MILSLILALSLHFAPPELRVTVSRVGDRLVELAWDASVDPVTGYKVSWGTTSGVYTQTLAVGNVTTATITLPAPDTAVYFFALQALGAGGTSAYSNEVSTASLPPADRCQAPLGDRSVAIFITRVLPTTGARGSQSAVDFQLASPNSPIVDVALKLDGVVARSMHGDDLLSTRGIWFTTPRQPGTYVLTVQATNQFGCSALQTKDALGRQILVDVK